MSTEKITQELLFSKRLKTLRGDRNKAKFSKELGIPAPMYQRYELGQIPKENNLRVIADKCGVTIDWLLGRDEKPTSEAVSGQVAVRAAGRQVHENDAVDNLALTVRQCLPMLDRRVNINQCVDMIHEQVEQVRAWFSGKGSQAPDQPS